MSIMETHRPAGKGLGDASLREIIDRYEGGESAVTIGAALNLSPATIGRHLAKAGIPRHHEQRKSKVDQAVAAYKADPDLKIRAAARMFHVDETQVRAAIRDAGIPLHSLTQHKNQPITPDLVARIEELWAAGVNISEISRECNVHRDTIRRHAKGPQPVVVNQPGATGHPVKKTATPPPADPNWAERANCTGTDPEVFYPNHDTSPDAKRIALRVCANCPVQIDCYRAAQRNGEWGIWGGTTQEQRRTA